MDRKRDIEYDLTKSLISLSRTALFEAEDKKDDIAIPITNDPKFGENVLQNQIDSCKQTVNPGVKFASENEDDPESNPLVYYPKSDNLIFSGSIPTMSGLKFQFSLNDVTNAPYIFVDGLALTDDVLTTLYKLKGFYENWKSEFLVASDLLDKLKKENG